MLQNGHRRRWQALQVAAGLVFDHSAHQHLAERMSTRPGRGVFSGSLGSFKEFRYPLGLM